MFPPWAHLLCLSCQIISSHRTMFINVCINGFVYVSVFHHPTPSCLIHPRRLSDPQGPSKSRFCTSHPSSIHSVYRTLGRYPLPLCTSPLPLVSSYLPRPSCSLKGGDPLWVPTRVQSSRSRDHFVKPDNRFLFEVSPLPV